MAEETDCSNELLWMGHFKDRNLANMVFRCLEPSPRTMGDLALFDEVKLEEAGLDQNQRAEVKNLLIQKGVYE